MNTPAQPDDAWDARWDAHCAKVRDQLRQMQPGDQWTPIPLPAADDPSPSDISYDEDSRWCYDHGHTGLLLLPGLGCDICQHLVDTDPRFAAALTDHKPDGTPRTP